MLIARLVSLACKESSSSTTLQLSDGILKAIVFTWRTDFSSSSPPSPCSLWGGLGPPALVMIMMMMMMMVMMVVVMFKTKNMLKGEIVVVVMNLGCVKDDHGNCDEDHDNWEDNNVKTDSTLVCWVEFARAWFGWALPTPSSRSRKEMLSWNISRKLDLNFFGENNFL